MIYKAMGNFTRTENGAEASKSTLDANLDFFATAGAMRNRSAIDLFSRAYSEDPTLAILNLFHLRDVRNGKGERKTARDCFDWLQKNAPDTYNRVLAHIPLYGRWDDVLSTLTPEVVKLVDAQLAKDLVSDNPSLLAKWMPSENTSSKATQRLARNWMLALGMTARTYRHTLTELRKKIRIVESLMSANEWNEINYSRIPSQAMTRYRKAYGKHDKDRFAAYLEDVKSGKTKINSATLFPYEIYEAYKSYDIDPVLEAQWKALPDLIDGNFVVMADVSGSMIGRPMAMSVSLAIYCAERMKGDLKGYYITFSSHPEVIKVNGKSLRENINFVQRTNVGYDTNIQAGFDALLNAAKRHNLRNEDMPRAVLVISDMEFNSTGVKGFTNHDLIKAKYKSAGYDAPILVYWNVDSRHENVAALNEDGVMLVSGASVHVFKSVCAMQNVIPTPRDVMLETLMSDRYTRIVESLK